MAITRCKIALRSSQLFCIERLQMRFVMLALILCGLAGTAAAIWMMPSDADHAAATDQAMLMGYADPPGTGALDGLRFDTTLGLQGTDERLVDYMQFDKGLFMSRECTDRCNYPPSAYLTRETADGVHFVIEAFCPTKSSFQRQNMLMTFFSQT